jgi:hypothetical protein
MNITINIPSLDRLCSILEKGIVINPTNSTGIIPSGDQVTPAPEVTTDPVPVTPKVKKSKTPAVTKTTPELTLEDNSEGEEDEPATLVVKAPTVESLTNLAKKYITQNSPAALRDLLDHAGIKGEKISTCSPKFYPDIEVALNNALDA